MTESRSDANNVQELMTRHQLWQLNETGIVEDSDLIWEKLIKSDWDSAFFPAGQYRFENTIELSRQIQLNGIKNGTEFYFPNDTNGLIAAAPFQTICGISFKGSLGPGAANGVTFKRPTLLLDCKVWNFSGNGIDLQTVGAFPDPPEERQFSNLWAIINCRSLTNGRHGLYVDGQDSNAGYALGLDASSNGEFGIFDSSFLGNFYFGCHCATNTLGGYRSDGLSSRNTFVGCYSESDNTNSFGQGDLLVGGLMTSNNGALYLDGNRWKGSVEIWGNSQHRLSLRAYATDYWRATNPADHPRGLAFKWDNLRQGYAFNHANVDARTGLFFKTGLTPWNRASTTAGPGTPVFPDGYGIGQKIRVFASDDFPTEDGNKGDRWINSDPDYGEYDRAVCLGGKDWAGIGLID